jgi:hypothetical protein
LCTRDRRGEKIILLEIEKVFVRELRKGGEQITRPAAIGSNCERAKMRRADLQLVREKENLERAIGPEFL